MAPTSPGTEASTHKLVQSNSKRSSTQTDTMGLNSHAACFKKRILLTRKCECTYLRIANIHCRATPGTRRFLVISVNRWVYSPRAIIQRLRWPPVTHQEPEEMAIDRWADRMLHAHVVDTQNAALARINADLTTT